MTPLLLALLADESGQGITEYAMLLGAVSLSSILTLSAIGTHIDGIYANVAHELDSLPILR